MAQKMVSWLDDPAAAVAHAARAGEKVRREYGIDSYIRGLAAAYDHARSQGSPN
jgi:hypothetical protein